MAATRRRPSAFSRATQQSFLTASKRISSAAKEIGRRFSPRMIGEEIMTDVKASRPGHGVPVDEGTLRNSGRVVGGGSGPAAIQRVSLEFGGAAAPYAVIQHENLWYHHMVGEARYLVRGLERWRPSGSKAMDALRKNAEAGINAAAAGGK